ncbi:unnamed protein product [Amoebophrya sp. A25]|nr:unnamed protein product [Amoebophrya sp. A25]|eukprot:GSA25T00027968001.1
MSRSAPQVQNVFTEDVRRLSDSALTAQIRLMELSQELARRKLQATSSSSTVRATAPAASSSPSVPAAATSSTNLSGS